MDKKCVLVIFYSKTEKKLDSIRADFRYYLLKYRPDNIGNEIRFHDKYENVFYSRREYKDIPTLLIIVAPLSQATFNLIETQKHKKNMIPLLYFNNRKISSSNLPRLVISTKDLDRNKLFEFITSPEIQERLIHKGQKGLKLELKKMLKKKFKRIREKKPRFLCIRSNREKSLPKKNLV
jgi:hypothetical protein